MGTLASQAQTTMWTGGTGVWSNNLNWSNGTPVAADTVYFSSSVTSTVDAAYTFTNLEFTGGAVVLNNSSGSLSALNGIFYTGGTSVAINVPIVGTGNLSLQGGTGTVTLNPGGSSNSYSGTTTIIDGGTLADGEPYSYSPNSIITVGGIGGGTLQVNYNENVATISDGAVNGSVLIAGGATLDLTGGYTATFSGVISGAGNLEKDLTGTLTLLGANTYTGTTVINGAGGTAIELGGGGSTGSIASSSVSGTGTLEFDRSNSYTYPGTLSGALQVVQAGTGTTTLSGTNTYSGSTTINNGMLKAGSTSAFGGATGLSAVSVGANGTLALSTFSNTVGSLASSYITSTVTIGSGAVLTVAGPGANTVFQGQISGAGGLNMDSYVLALTNGNLYSGNTTISSGTLLADNTSGSATGIGSTITILAPGTLQIGNSDTKGFITASAGIADGGNVTFALSGGTLSFPNAIVGMGALNKFGAGTVSLSGGNTYSGPTSVYSGTLTDGASGAFSGSSSMVISSGATLAVTNYENVGDLEDGGGGGMVTIALGQVLTSMGINYPGDFTGAISGGGSFTIAAGVQGLGGNNTYSGGTTISGTGELYVSSDTALGTGTLTFAGPGPEMSPNADVTLSNPIVLNAIFDNDDGGTNSMTLTGPISGGSEIEWCAPGTLTLTHANTFTGGIDMREGTLVVGNNTAAGLGGTITLDSTSTLNVMGGITLSNPLNFTGTGAIVTGSGTIATAVTANSSNVLEARASPGGGPGTLTFSSGLTLGSGSAINFDIYDALGSAGTGYSLLATNALTLSASVNGITFNVVSTDGSGNPSAAINFSSGNPYSWTFASSTAPITTFNANMFNLVGGGFSNSLGGGTFSVSQSGNNLELNFTPVPEPSTWALLGAGSLAVLGLAARRRRAVRA